MTHEIPTVCGPNKLSVDNQSVRDHNIDMPMPCPALTACSLNKKVKHAQSETSPDHRHIVTGTQPNGGKKTSTAFPCMKGTLHITR